MGMIIGLVFQLVILGVRFLWWCGGYWLFIFMLPSTLFTVIGNRVAKTNGSFLGVQPNVVGNVLPPSWVDDTGFHIAIVFMVLTVIQNIYRYFSSDQEFNIFKAIFEFIFDKIGDLANVIRFRRLVSSSKRTDKDGFVADVKTDTAKSVSGFVFGKHKGKYVTKKEDEEGHMLIIGGQGSGKSSCIAIPTLMRWKNRVFAIDIKGELYQKTKNKRNPEFIKVFDPTNPNAMGYDPYYMLKNTDDLASEAKALALSICPLPASVKDPYWIKSAQNMLTGFIIYFFEYNVNFSDTMIYIKSKPVKELIAEIMVSETQAKLFLTDYVGLDDKTLGGIFSELSNHITLFATNKDLIRALSGEGDCITPQDLEEGYDIYCCIPEHKLEEWKELFGMMCNQFLKSFERRKEGTGEPILFLIDEFGRLGKIEVITNALSTLRSKKIQIALFIQSKSQLNANYGKDIAEIIADNCNYKAILKAGDPSTQEWCSKLVGTYEKKKLSTSKNSNMMGLGKGLGTSQTTEEKKIIKPEAFGYMRDIVCIFPTGYMRIKKMPYFKDRAFKKAV
jgi:type IV secretion system protein VirD4